MTLVGATSSYPQFEKFSEQTKLEAPYWIDLTLVMMKYQRLTYMQ